MRRRTALGLAVAGGASLAASLLVAPGRDALPDGAGRLVFPDLAGKLAQAARIELSGTGKTATLVRQGDTWGLAERQAYPIQLARLRELLTGLAELRLLEPRTADPALYARLGVDDPSPTATSTRLRVLDGSGAVLATMIAGHRRTLTQGGVPEQVYLRLPGEARSWLAEGRLPADADPLSWIVRDLVDIPRAKVASVRISKGADTLVVTRDGDAFRLSSPEGQKTEDYKVDQVGAALEQLTLSDVRKPPRPGDALGTSVFHMTDGLELTVALNREGSTLWAGIAASGPGAERYATLADWAFQMPDWKEKALLPSLSDLLPAPPAKPEPAKDAPAAGGSEPPEPPPP